MPTTHATDTGSIARSIDRLLDTAHHHEQAATQSLEHGDLDRAVEELLSARSALSTATDLATCLAEESLARERYP